MVGSDFVTEDELDAFIQQGFEKLYNYLVAKYESYFAAFATEQDLYSYSVDSSVTSPLPVFGLIAGQKDYYFPEKFFKLRRMSIGRGTPSIVSFTVGGEYVPNGAIVESTNRGGWEDLQRIEWEDEYKINPNESQGKPRYYILHGRNDFDYAEDGVAIPARAEGFRLVPTPDRAYPMDIVYIPTAPKVQDGMNFWNGWDKYVILDAAIECRDKEEGDCSVLIQRQKDFLTMVESAFINRDANNAPQVGSPNPFLSEDWEEMTW